MKTVVSKNNSNLLIIGFLILGLIQCYKVSVHEQTHTQVLPLHFSYGLAKGAKIEIEFNCDKKVTLYAALLNSQQLQYLLYSELYYPKKSFIHPCRIQTQNRFEFKNYVKEVINITKTDKYTICILNCQQDLITIHGKIHYQNTFRQEFPEGKQFYPEIYGLTCLIYIFFFILWTKFLIKNWKIRKSFQICIWLICLAKNGQLALNMINSVQLLTTNEPYQTLPIIANTLHALVRDSTLILVLLYRPYYFRPLITNPFLYFEVYQENYQIDKELDFESDNEHNYLVNAQSNDIQINNEGVIEDEKKDENQVSSYPQDENQYFNIDTGGLNSSDFI
ncbi:lung seven transmembrane receptor [Anaeramoeba flamelloides]|uniref:Lung seven transmembrane receptor n=1 Tax=Anaeramoeba flamelloides TaxID=1746091 RepID=A0ABQ8XEP4_9EUKA|nr:lung seven transmembrane receptor [Anaeramoeba flamelloides]